MRSAHTEIFDAFARSSGNTVWGALTMEVLARLGLQTVVTSPGSRSTPLTVAATRNPKIEALSILDERSAAFFALGLAKRTRRPVALVCTSGTALANYAPAVVEASMSGVPLLLLTADRPAELRHCSSGQTIDQIKFFGAEVRAFVELPVPEATEPMWDYLRQTLVHAVHRAMRGNPGPVHLNFPFRDPLLPEGDPQAGGAQAGGAQDPVVDAATLERMATVLLRADEAAGASNRIDPVALERLSSHRRGLIVVGTETPAMGDAAFVAAVATMAQQLGWPVLADALNPLRNHAGALPGLITHYDAFLRDTGLGERLAPTAVLQIGSLPTSKVLRAWLGALPAVAFLLSPRGVNTDPLHRVAVPLQGDVDALAASLETQSGEAEWLEAWRSAETRTRASIDQAMAQADPAFEGRVAWQLVRCLPEGSAVFWANSMSVRYAEYFWSAGDRAVAMHCNRGANGIDGTLSTAMGLAHGGPPTVLVTGDLAFLHDSNGLLARPLLRGRLTVVLINNQGGGIFEHLPVARLEPPFESHFATAQEVDFAQLCAAHGVAHRLLADARELPPALHEATDPGITVLELKTDRKKDRDTLRQLLRAL